MEVNHYIIRKNLGDELTTNISLAQHSISKKLVVLKSIKRKRIFDIGKKQQKAIEQEINIMKELSGHNKGITNLIETCDIKNSTILVTEYASHGNLFNKVRTMKNGFLSEKQARHYFTQLIDTIEFIHSKNIVHRDLRLENMLIDKNNNLLVSNFGSAVKLSHSTEKMHTKCGSPFYLAPEIFRSAQYNGKNTDIWSCGVVLYYMVTGMFPFQGVNLLDIGRKICTTTPEFPGWISADLVNLIKGILSFDMHERFQIKDIKNHRWIKKKSLPPLNNTCPVRHSIY
ncbi:CAMK family protein kinase [Tritrichomonas foetus]|uniref:non-specific serine/threonine protein kinase n=1 Tax=Tritrichomonas foetus TaxID=1144522 RepID=A0A1J4JWK4_9EUKA|nr:CAMK family protein kinase [Tritrichomonas foetus]|eukprot:OHT01910.1 CAMK family protein kinase [Tritrichomonas foetus]